MSEPITPESLALMVGRAGVAQILGVSTERVRQLVARGDLPYLVTALGNLYDPEEVARLHARRRHRAGFLIEK